MWVKYSISGLLFYAITGLEVLLFHNYSIVFVASILCRDPVHFEPDLTYKKRIRSQTRLKVSDPDFVYHLQNFVNTTIY